MLCESCQEIEATIHIEEITTKGRRSTHLCAGCAAAQGILQGNGEGINLSAVVTKAMVEDGEAATAAPCVDDVEDTGARADEPVSTCAACGTTDKDFRRSGLLGCPTCYATFDFLIRAMLPAMHRGLRHAGRGLGDPAVVAGGNDTPDLPQLEQELQRAVATESYERAAEVRDAIQRLQKADTGGGA